MPSRGIPQSFWLIFVFGLLAAGIISLAGFAIDKADRKDANVALAGAEAAVLAQLDSGRITLADLDPTDPVRVRLEEEGAEVPEEEQPPAEEEQPPAELQPGDADRGQQVFFQNGCSACHGDTGQGGIGPTLALTSLTVEQVLQQYRSPRGFMPAFGPDAVSDQEVADVRAWLQTLPLPDTIVPGEGTP
ncbi:MAG: Cytochrome c, mono- and diheme variants [Chloroflexi bacterium]|nr:MAG: Cytochrome c, mono- and diheme variants [Chloroflexota bacterium]